jgi:hypothetical protein
MTQYEDLLPHDPTLSDFQHLPIWREDKTASVIVAYELPERKALRLAGFFCESELDDFDIREKAFMFYYELKTELEK